MCGISGRIIGASLKCDSFDLQSDAFRAIRSRGPDSHGIENFLVHGHAVSLAHSRLAIIDLSLAGHQPMQDEVSGWWISFNGEIYNYREIMQELRSLGWSFRSASDTEVLLKAWAHWGVGALSRLNGMFALACFHPASGQLWLVRDRFGVKPLAWGHLPQGGVVFSSSVASIAAQVSADIDTGYCARGVRYKVFETAGSGSPFKQVRSVPAGGWIRFQLYGDRIEMAEGCWYDLQQAVAQRAQSIAHCSDVALVAQCRDLVEDAIRLRLRSDVPVAVSLSGGLDSSTIAALASGQMNKLRGFTYGSPAAPASEGPQVDCLARALGIDITYVWPGFHGAALDRALERTMAFQEAPFSGLSLLAQNCVYAEARGAGFKVLLGGQGADEILAGYRKFFLVALREALHKREAGDILRLLYSLVVMMAHEAGQARMYLQSLNRYRPGYAPAFRLLDFAPVTENLWGEAGPSLSGRQMEDIQRWSLPTLLRYEDRNSMGYGVETRLPFMDYRLLELALALPARLKTRNGYGKWALRQITAGVVPDPIRLNRRKRGFDVSQPWIAQGIGAALRSRLFENRHALDAYLRPGANLDGLLTDASLQGDSNLLDEALMLAWLVQPVRAPVAVTREAIGA